MKKLILLLVLTSCSSTPAPKTVEIDLCRARAVFKGLELSDSSLAPSAGSVRANVEADEDALCALL